MHIALLGVGNMGRAIMDGLLRMEQAPAITAWDALPQARALIPNDVTVAPPAEWFTKASIPDAVILAVKPADLPPAGSELRGLLPINTALYPLFISIAAGVGIETLGTWLAPQSRICRVMPNTPAKAGAAMSAYACGATCTAADRTIVETIFSACGRVVAVPEKMLHAITGLSGSGPAYVFLFIEALIEGGVTAGLPFAIARECAVQTVLGAAQMMQQSTEHPGALKAAVMSPGGTTAAGLRTLEKGAFKHAVIEAVNAATARSAELGG